MPRFQWSRTETLTTIFEGIRPGLRVVSFERRIAVAFVVEDGEAVILRLLYAGQAFEPETSGD